MKIKVVYFGLIVDAIKIESEQIDRGEFSTNLNTFFEARHTELKKINYKIAVDGEFSNEISETTQEIALFPPFAGG